MPTRSISREEHESESDEVMRLLSCLVDTLVAVIRPRFSTAEDNMRSVLERLALEMSDFGLPAIRFETACIHMVSREGGRACFSVLKLPWLRLSGR